MIRETEWAVIFDMDGVLVDSESHWLQVENEFLSGLVPGWGEADQQRVIGMSAYDVHRMLAEDYGVKLDRAGYVSYYHELAREIYGSRATAVPGALELLEALRLEGVACGLASSSPRPWIEIVLQRFNLAHLLQVVTSSDDVGGVGKPAPDIYLHAVAQFRTAAAVAIEDTDKGIRSAASAKLRCVGLRTKFNRECGQSLSEADLVVDSLFDLNPPVLRRLAAGA